MNHKYIPIVKNTILTCATFHLIILAFFALKNQDITLINGFNILDLDLFFPNLSYGWMNFILSYCLIGAVVGFFYLKQKKSA